MTDDLTAELKEIVETGPNDFRPRREYALEADATFGRHVVNADHHEGRSAGGITTHRGILHPDEYVDPKELRKLVERELGYTTREVHSVYVRPGGRLPDSKLDLREAIDARLLALQEAGGNMTALATVLGIGERTMDRALSRAREARA